MARGDWIVGDADGLVVVPGEAVEAILREAEDKASTDNAIRDSLRRGMLPLEAYEQYGTF